MIFLKFWCFLYNLLSIWFWMFWTRLNLCVRERRGKFKKFFCWIWSKLNYKTSQTWPVVLKHTRLTHMIVLTVESREYNRVLFAFVWDKSMERGLYKMRCLFSFSKFSELWIKPSTFYHTKKYKLFWRSKQIFPTNFTLTWKMI